MLNDARIGRVYGFDLTGAGAGRAAGAGADDAGAPVPPGALPAGAAGRRAAGRCRDASRLASPPLPPCSAARRCCCCDNAAAFNDFKAIYAPLHVPNSRATGGNPLAARPLHAARRLHRARRYRRLQRRRHARPARAADRVRPVSRRQPHRRPAQARRDRRRLCRRHAGGAALSRCTRTRTCCWSALPAAFASPRLRKLGAASIDALEPEPVLRGALRTAWASRRPIPPTPGRAHPGRQPDRRGRAPTDLRPHRHLRRFPGRRPRPTPAPSPPRPSPPICAR